jgi:hypothetical protein
VLSAHSALRSEVGPDATQDDAGAERPPPTEGDQRALRAACHPNAELFDAN